MVWCHYTNEHLFYILLSVTGFSNGIIAISAYGIDSTTLGSFHTQPICVQLLLTQDADFK